MSDDNQTKNSLLLFQLGPVQSFIAQAETAGDLWAGSYLLSNLVWEGLKQIPNRESAVIFPDLSTDVVKKALEEHLIPTIPNRFLAEVPFGTGTELAEKIKKVVKEKLDGYVKDLELDDELKEAALKQTSQFLQMTWSVLENPSGNMGEDYKAIGRLMALRRNVREFKPWEASFKGGQKDFLSGKEEALQGKRGALNLIKQSLAKSKKQENQIEEKYIAVIAMDGDRMGATLSSFPNGGEHRNFSRSLAEFAIAVTPIIEEFAGQLIYAGGDDVLAIVPAEEAVTCAAKLSNLFSENVKNKDSENLTASAGIAIGHSSVPLQDLVHAAHDAESRAKKTYGRNALAISIYKRSGEILEWGCKWKSPALEIYKTLSELDRNEKQIGGFPYKLAGLLQPYAIEGKLADGMHEIVMAEFKHAISQTEDMRGELDEQQVEDYLTQCESKRGEDFLTLFLAEAFINRPPKGN